MTVIDVHSLRNLMPQVHSPMLAGEANDPFLTLFQSGFAGLHKCWHDRSRHLGRAFSPTKVIVGKYAAEMATCVQIWLFRHD